MNKLLKNALFALSALLMLTGCVHDDDYGLPPLHCEDRWESNSDISAIKALNDTAEPMEITEDYILKGYVVSSDEAGNFFKSIVIQDDPTNPSAGLTLEVDFSDYYTDFPIGSTVLVDTKGLHIAKDRGTYKIGSPYAPDDNLPDETRVGRMSEALAYEHIALSCVENTTIEPVAFNTIEEALEETNTNTLIKLENVQFQTVGEGITYYDEDNDIGGSSNVTVVDSEGTTVVLRTSSYADFATDVLPDGSGSITAILGAYTSPNNNTPTASDYQLTIRNASDVNLDQPRMDCTTSLVSNTTIAEVKALNNAATPYEITDDLVVEGIVVSSDSEGNFFKTLVIQDSATDPTAGLSVEVDLTNTYAQYPVGSSLLVDLNGLFIAKDRGTYKIGSTFEDSNGNIRVGRMDENTAEEHLVEGCGGVMDVTPQVFYSIPEALDESNINTLIQLQNVQFQSAGNGETYYDEDNAFGGATNVTVIDADGNTIVLRNSQYADFADEELPDGNGTLTAVLSAYSSSNNVTPSTYQMFIRDTSDVNFDQPRVVITNGEGPVGGGNASFASCVTEDFESYSEDLVSFQNYINYAYNGDRYWNIQNYNNNNYLQMSSYNANGQNEVYFIVPVNFDDADEFSFSSKARYFSGAALTVYYSTDYAINGDIPDLTDITSEFNISNGSSDDFVSSGSYSLSNISGNGAIFFKYEGSPSGVTTTIQLDDIAVIDLDNDDCEAGGGGNGGGNGGNDATIPFSEDFSGGIPSTWSNITVSGDRAWQGRDYNGTYYVNNSAYSSGNILDVEAWLITPAFDFDAQTGESLDLAIADAFNNGNPLTIYYSSNYTDGADPSTATWTEIGTDELNGLPTNPNTYDNNYDETSIDLSGLSGANHIAFVYDSEGTVSTTIQIGNVGISSN